MGRFNYNRFVRLKASLGSLFSDFEHFKFSHAEFLEKRETIMRGSEAMKLRETDRSYMRGYCDALWVGVEAKSEWCFHVKGVGWVPSRGIDRGPFAEAFKLQGGHSKLTTDRMRHNWTGTTIAFYGGREAG